MERKIKRKSLLSVAIGKCEKSARSNTGRKLVVAQGLQWETEVWHTST